MYRQIFMTEQNNIHIPVPDEWKGMEIEVIAFPIASAKGAGNKLSVADKRKKRDALLDKYLIDLSDFKFNRDEANDYD